MEEEKNYKHWIVYSYLDNYSELESLLANYVNANLDSIFENMSIEKEQLFFNLGANYAYQNQSFYVDLLNHKINIKNTSSKTNITKFNIQTNLDDDYIRGTLLKGYNIIDNTKLLINSHIIDSDFDKIGSKSLVKNTLQTEDVIRYINKTRNQIAHCLHNINLKEVKFDIISDHLLAKYLLKYEVISTNSIYNVSESDIEEKIVKLDDDYKIILTSYIYMNSFKSKYSPILKKRLGHK